MAVKLGSHVVSTTGLVWSRTEAGCWGVGDLSLEAGLRIAASTSPLMGVATSSGGSGPAAHVVAHVTMCGVGGLASEVAGLGSRDEMSLGCWANLTNDHEPSDDI